MAIRELGKTMEMATGHYGLDCTLEPLRFMTAFFGTILSQLVITRVIDGVQCCSSIVNQLTVRNIKKVNAVI